MPLAATTPARPTTTMPNKAKPPPYPRPVPFIDVNEIPICPGTIVYETETDPDSDEKEAKRRKRQSRITEYANAYLRGEQVLILSAGLKGPFEGWRNPWGKKVGKRRREVESEVPETEAAGTKYAMQARDEQKKPPLERLAMDATPSGERRRLSSPFTARVGGPKAKANDPEPPLSTRRVEDWLKTNNAYARRSPEKFSSPTPTAARVNTSARKPEAKVEGRDAIEGKTKSIVPEPNPSDDASRAEFAIMANKRRSIHMVPPSTHLPAFEYRRGGRLSNKEQEFSSPPPRTKHGQTMPLRSSPQKAASSPGHREPLAPPDQLIQPRRTGEQPNVKLELTTETSRASTATNLPSAQPVPVARVEQGASIVASENMLEELPQISTNRSDERADLTVSAVGPEPAREIEQASESNLRPNDAAAKVATPVSAVKLSRKTPQGAPRPPRELDTQELLAGIEPLGFSTVKKTVTDCIQKSAPLTATKMGQPKSKKRASFAVERGSSGESQGSLKRAFGVKKTPVSMEGKPGSQQPSMFGKLGLDMETSEEDEERVPHHGVSLPSPSSPFAAREATAPKSILKTSTVISSLAAPTPSNATTATSMKQDAQHATTLPGDGTGYGQLDEDENFDLDAAIDDLGGYLGTWDAEKEASGLVI